MNRNLLVLAALFGVLFLVQLDVPGLFDYDEACYAEVARSMHVRGSWLVPTLNGESFFEKPPFLYWTQIVGYHLLGVSPLGARFLNALGALALVVLVYLFSRRPLGERAAFWSALFLGTSLETFGLARIAFTDTFLTLWLVCCLGCFHRAAESWREDPAGGTGWFLAACFFSGVAMLAKGAVGVVLPGAAILLYVLIMRRPGPLFRPLRLVSGLVLLAGVGLSWYLLLGATHEGGFGFMRELFWEHHVGRFTDSMQGHAGPFFFYLPVLIGGFLPWSPFLLPAFGRQGLIGAANEARRFLTLLGLFGAITLVFFSAAATKLPNYIAPVLPVAALLAGHAFARLAGSHVPASRAWKWAFALTTAFLMLLAVGLALVPAILERLPDWLGDKALKRPGLAEPMALGPWPYVLAAWVGAAAWSGFLRSRQRRWVGAAGSWAFGMAGFYLLVTFFVLPRYDAHFSAPLRNLAHRAAAEAAPGRAVVLFGVRHAPSVVFHGGRVTRYVSRHDAREIAGLFQGPTSEVGITISAYLDRLTGPGRLQVLDRQKGYVLFRCSPGEGGGWRTRHGSGSPGPGRSIPPLTGILCVVRLSALPWVCAGPRPSGSHVRLARGRGASELLTWPSRAVGDRFHQDFFDRTTEPARQRSAKKTSVAGSRPGMFVPARVGWPAR